MLNLTEIFFIIKLVQPTNFKDDLSNKKEFSPPSIKILCFLLKERESFKEKGEPFKNSPEEDTQILSVA